MIRVVFDLPAGTVAAEGQAGDTLLRVAQGAGLPLEGTCNGQMACATCHLVIAAEWAGRLPPPVEAEEEMLDLAPRATRHSRLACQVVLTPALGGLVARLP